MDDVIANAKVEAIHSVGEGFHVSSIGDTNTDGTVKSEVSPCRKGLSVEDQTDVDRLVSAIRLEGNADQDAMINALLGDSDHLMRILVARKRDMEACVQLFLEQVRWRKRWNPTQIHPDSIPTALPSGAWRLCGRSKEGCIVSNYKLQYWNPNEYGAGTSVNDEGFSDNAVDEYVRYVAYMIELTIGCMPPHPVPQQFVVIFDLKGFSTSLVFNSNARQMIRKLIYVAQAQYPERLRKVLLVNAPYGFSAAWSLVSALLDEKTVSKINFCTISDIAKDVDLSCLPAEYGGTHAEYPVPTKPLSDQIQLQRES